MKSFVTLLVACSIMLVLLVAGCSSAATTAASSTSTTTPAQQGDDILNTPNGFAYRADVNQQGQTNPFTPIQTSDVALSGGRVTYRADIQAARGTVRNNIVSVYQVFNGQSTLATAQLAVTLSVQSLPAGASVRVNVGDQWFGPDRTQTVLNITISAQAGAGDYDFDIAVEVNGQSWGTVPCAVHVIS